MSANIITILNILWHEKLNTCSAFIVLMVIDDYCKVNHRIMVSATGWGLIHPLSNNAWFMQTIYDFIGSENEDLKL